MGDALVSERVGLLLRRDEPSRRIIGVVTRGDGGGAFGGDRVQCERIVGRQWVRANPGAGMDLLNTNPSYVFFRKLTDLPASQGPIGAMGRSITTLRSVAVDPAHIALGTPVWVEKSGADPMHRLMVAQDTGGAIKGAQRADIFFGTGPAAGQAAGQIKDGGRLLLLLPIDHAYTMAPAG